MAGETEWVKRVGEKIRRVVREIDARLSEREARRDAALKKSRDVIRLSGWAINALHRGDLEKARNHIAEMRKAVKEFLAQVQGDPVLFYSGFTNNTLAEYVEAELFYQVVMGGELPGPEELGVPDTPYLQGLGDTIGEIRRLILDLLRQDEVEKAEHLLSLIESIYYEMRGLEYPEALIPGVRHKVDVARRLIDDTKALILEVKGRKEVLRIARCAED